VALVYDGTNRALYLNGVFEGAGTAPVITAETDTSSIGNVVPNDRASFNGGIDEISIYNRALSSNEIVEIHLAGSYGKCVGYGSPTLGLGSAQPLTTNGLSLMLHGYIGSNYVIEASTDLLNWVPVTNFAIINSPFYFTDPTATNYQWRFYRATMP